jgi:4-hydroxyphenylpyruvate dioxygenase-like putative hemolysin
MVFSYQDKEWKSDYNPEATGLKYIDHMVGNVGWNEMNTCEVLRRSNGICKFL